MASIGDLLPDLKKWNEGAGIDPLDWLYCGVAKSDEAMAYAALFWPIFVLFDGYVLREGFSEPLLRDWEQSGTSRSGVEAMMNRLDLSLLFQAETEAEPLCSARARYLGRVLVDIHETKLKHDFPARQFRVALIDEMDDLYVTFSQC